MIAWSIVWYHAGCAGIWFDVEDLVAIGTSDIADVRITRVTGSWPGLLRNCQDMRAKLVAIGDLCLAVLTPAMTTCCVGIELPSRLSSFLACLQHNACSISSPHRHVFVNFITRRIPYISATPLSSTGCDMKERLLQLMPMGSCLVMQQVWAHAYISND